MLEMQVYEIIGLTSLEGDVRKKKGNHNRVFRYETSAHCCLMAISPLASPSLSGKSFGFGSLRLGKRDFDIY